MTMFSNFQYNILCYNNFFADLTLTEDVIKLIQTLVYFEQQMSEFFSSAFEKELSQLKSPDVVMNDLLIKIKTEMGFEVTISFLAANIAVNSIFYLVYRTD